MVGSPCIDVCKVMDNQCMGCSRSVQDISSWSRMTDMEKRKWWDERNLCYAGIGSRETPSDVKNDLTIFSTSLDNMGYCLRSGGAIGADLAFEEGSQRHEIYTVKHRKNAIALPSISLEIQNKAAEIAQKHHGGWHNLDDYSRKLMTRNVMQVLGKDLATPVQFVLFWTKKTYCDDQGHIKNASGGTGMAVRLAYSLGIPVIHTHLKEMGEFHEAILREDFRFIHQYCQEKTRMTVIEDAPKKLKWKRG